MTITEILDMGSYGMYIWPAYCLTAGVLIANIVLAFYETRRTRKIISHYIKMHYES